MSKEKENLISESTCLIYNTTQMDNLKKKSIMFWFYLFLHAWQILTCMFDNKQNEIIWMNTRFWNNYLLLCWKTTAHSTTTLKPSSLFTHSNDILIKMSRKAGSITIMYRRGQVKIVSKALQICQYKWTHGVRLSPRQTDPVPSKSGWSQYPKFDFVYTYPLIHTSLLSYCQRLKRHIYIHKKWITTTALIMGLKLLEHRQREWDRNLKRESCSPLRRMSSFLYLFV